MNSKRQLKALALSSTNSVVQLSFKLTMDKDTSHLLFIFVSIIPDIGIMVREIGVQSQVESYQRLKKWHLMLIA